MEWCKGILVTEDHDDTRELVVHILKQNGHKVRSAANGSEALEILREITEPTLILLDLMMPVMDGWKFLKFHRQGEHKVICISAVRPDTADDVSAWEGVDELLPKPLHMEDLLRMVHKYCGAGHARELAL